MCCCCAHAGKVLKMGAISMNAERLSKTHLTFLLAFERVVQNTYYSSAGCLDAIKKLDKEKEKSNQHRKSEKAETAKKVLSNKIFYFPESDICESFMLTSKAKNLVNQI
jgi:Mn-containing catalase